MSLLFDDSSNQYLDGSAVLTTTPITMACWATWDDLTTLGNDTCLMTCIDDSSTLRYHMLVMESSDNHLEIRTRTNFAGAGIASAGTGPTVLNQWYHCCGVFASSTSRSVYFDGANKVTNTTSKAPTGIDTTSIGAARASSLYFPHSGRIAHAAVWDVALTDIEVSLLARGVSPMRVRRGNLKAYWDLIDGNVQDHASGQYPRTAVAGPTASGLNPPVQPPFGFDVVGPYVVGGVEPPTGIVPLRRRIEGY